jgi:hypothetical protein
LDFEDGEDEGEDENWEGDPKEDQMRIIEGSEAVPEMRKHFGQIKACFKAESGKMREEWGSKSPNKYESTNVGSEWMVWKKNSIGDSKWQSFKSAHPRYLIIKNLWFLSQG